MSYGIPGIAMSYGTGSGISPVPFEPPKELFRYGEQSLWSAQALTAGPARQEGFAAMSYAETSLREGGRIPAQQSFDVFGIACHIYHGVADGSSYAVPTDTSALIGNLLNLQNNSILQWSFLQTNIDIAPVVMIGAGGGAFGSVSQNAAGSNLGNMNNGAGQIWLYRAAAVALPGQSTFNVILRFGSYAAAISAANRVAVKISLIGNYKTAMVVG